MPNCFGLHSWEVQTTAQEFWCWKVQTTAQHFWSCVVQRTAQRFWSWILESSNDWPTLFGSGLEKFDQVPNCFGLYSREVQTTAQAFCCWKVQTTAQRFWYRVLGSSNYWPSVLGFEDEKTSQHSCCWGVQSTAQRFWSRVLRVQTANQHSWSWEVQKAAH